MRGHDEQTTHMFSYLSPEQRVPADHPLRAVRALTDEALRRESVVWSGAARSTPINDKTDRKKPSAWRKGNRKTRRSVNAVSIAQSEIVFGAPGRPDGDGRHASVASAESHSVTSPRWTKACSYADQFPTRYFALYFGWTFDLMSRSCTRSGHRGQRADSCLVAAEGLCTNALSRCGRCRRAAYTMARLSSPIGPRFRGRMCSSKINLRSGTGRCCWFYRRLPRRWRKRSANGWPRASARTATWRVSCCPKPGRRDSQGSGSGVPVADLLRQHGVSRTTCFKWRSKYAGASVADVKRLRELEGEHAKLKRALSQSARAAPRRRRLP